MMIYHYVEIRAGNKDLGRRRKGAVKDGRLDSTIQRVHLDLVFNYSFVYTGTFVSKTFLSEGEKTHL